MGGRYPARTRMPILVHTNGSGREYVLGERTVIGRMDSCDVRILDGLISKRHAEIAHANGRWSLRDLGSSNGTLVNGCRVHAHDLREGDEIVLGGARLVFSYHAAKQAAPQVELVDASAPHVQATLER